MSSHGNGAPGASGTGPALGYTLNLFWFNILFMLISENNMNKSTYFVHTLSLIYVMNLVVIFGIKIYQKLPRSLTVWSPTSLVLKETPLFSPPPPSARPFSSDQETMFSWFDDDGEGSQGCPLPHQVAILRQHPRRWWPAALPVKEHNRHVTSNGRGSLSLGLMSPSGGEGFPSGGILVLSPNDDGGPPSAGHFPPDSWRDPSRQHQTLVEAKKN